MKFHITLAVTFVGGLLLVVAPFVPKLSRGAAFLRTQVFVAGLSIMIWSVVGLYVDLHEASDGTHSTLPWPEYWRLVQIRWIVAGSALTLLITMFINPQFHELRRAARAKA